MKKISIITICFNSASTIEETIISIITQKYPNLEYLIIDGGSTDGTIDIINKYLDKIDYFISESDNGISDAFNKGIRAASGEIIGIINSDDILYKDALLNVNKAYLENPDIDVVFGNCITFFSDNYMGRIKKPNVNLDTLKIGFEMCHQSMFVKKDTYLKYGMYDLDYKLAMDFELFSKMYLSGANFLYVNYSFSCFRYGGTSYNQRKLFKENKQVAIRNGVSEMNYRKYIFTHFSIRPFIIATLKKAGIYYRVRSILNPQNEYNVVWWQK